MVSQGGRSESQDRVVDMSLPEVKLTAAVAWLSKERERLAESQWRHGVMEPIALSSEALALALSWASGGDWKDVSEEGNASGMADGDIFRCLMRTLEVLTGLEAVVDKSFVGSAWHTRLKSAIDAMDRSPLRDNMVIDEGTVELDLGL
mmetsp:Transcript_44879/g.116577  ORF Transcript_44879/g.116577 Transcript_44879/m.116577 type:complete len:148 (-) Transcript_44879:59-502(-)